ncbi:MAG: hypothetical protein R3B93_24360 [Bacteroidia bacterium]
MKYILYILTSIIGLITSLFIWIYIQRVNIDYNSESRFFSPEDGVVYHEQARDVYGVFALLGLILTGLLLAGLIMRRKKHAPDKT